MKYLDVSCIIFLWPVQTKQSRTRCAIAPAANEVEYYGTSFPKKEFQMKLKYTWPQIFLEIAGAALIAGTAVFLVLNWNTFPERIPTHFNMLGQADAWGPKSDSLFLPILGIGLYALITVLTFFPAIWNMNLRYKEENKTAVYQTVKTMILVLKIEVVAMFLYIFYYMASAQNLPGYFTPAVLAFLLVPILLFILRAYRAGNKQEGDY